MDCFIKTKDKGTSDSLISSGVKLLSFENGIWTFLNEGKLTFEEKEKINNKVVYTNTLFV